MKRLLMAVVLGGASVGFAQLEQDYLKGKPSMNPENQSESCVPPSSHFIPVDSPAPAEGAVKNRAQSQSFSSGTVRIQFNVRSNQIVDCVVLGEKAELIEGVIEVGAEIQTRGKSSKVYVLDQDCAGRWIVWDESGDAVLPVQVEYTN